MASIAVSPAMEKLTSAVAWPGAKLTDPLAGGAGAKSALLLLPWLKDQVTVSARPRLPVRLMTKVAVVVPALPSVTRTSGEMLTTGGVSLSRMTKAAEVLLPSTAPLPVRAPRVTTKPSSGSTSKSSLELKVTVLLSSPEAKLTTPLGSVPPKSAASTPPLTAQAMVVATAVLPARVTVKV